MMTQDELEAAALAYLFENANAGLRKISTTIVASKIQAPVARVNFALQALEKKRLARASHNSLTGSAYEISEEGYRELERRQLEEREKAATSDGADRTASLPDGFVLDEERRVTLVRELDLAEAKLPELDVSQEVMAQARAYVVAAKALSEAPEPPASLIWDIITRANSLAGIASLLVAIVALFH